MINTNGVTKRQVSDTVQEAFDRHVKQDKLNKLQSLLTRAHAYSKFLAERLREQIQPVSSPSKEGVSRERGREDAFHQPESMKGTLRGYQLEGVQWLVSLFENGLNGILADEMGLGKTVQCIGLLTFLREQGVMGPFLVVAPLSTLANWMSELSRFAPSLTTLMYHGAAAERDALRRKYFGGGKVGEKFSVVVTSYEIAMRDVRHLSPIHWKYLIIDEGHRLKNLNCRLIKELKAFNSDNRLLITGTPLQNNLTELWSLLNFLLPEIFNDVDDFLSWFDMDLEDADDATVDTQMVAQLHAILKPLLLRRLKVDVEAELPRKREYVLSATLSPLQREYYQAITEGKLRDILGRGKILDEEPTKKRRKVDYNEADVSVDSEQDLMASSSSEEEPPAPTSSTGWTATQGLQNKIMQLRKVCNHPYLFLYPTDTKDPSKLIIDETIISVSGKMRLLDQLLMELQKRKHKVLIFSQMSRVLDIIEDYLGLRHLSFSRIDGSVPQAERQVQIDRFNADPKCSVFLLSTRAGGLGINLVAADTVIFYDSDWVITFLCDFTILYLESTNGSSSPRSSTSNWANQTSPNLSSLHGEHSRGEDANLCGIQEAPRAIGHP